MTFKERGLQGLSVLEERVNAQHRVVRLDARRGDLRARPNREGDLRLLAVVDGEALEEQAAETGASATAARVEDPTFFSCHDRFRRRFRILIQCRRNR